MSLKEFLETKELYYKDIDYDFFPSVWKNISCKFSYPKVIHLVGTNGKGSTGRFLSSYLYKAGYKVGHYSSPHILRFNERIWINGSDAGEQTLEKAHQKLSKKLDKELLKKLSYFEYTTLLAIEVFQNCDYIVMEAGLGGEYDATSVFDKLFSLVTPIGLDHQSFLGESLKDIASTKLRSVTTYAIMAKQKDEVYEVAKSLGIKYFDSRSFFTQNELQKMEEFIKKNSFASYLFENLILAMSAVKSLDIEYDMKFLEGVKLKGRFQKIAKNIILDVGHNLQAAQAIKNELKDKKITLIYNTYKDKDFQKILSVLKENIKKVLIIDVKGDRVADKESLQKALKLLKIPYEEFSKDKMSDDEEYLVFGSFSVAETFLKSLDLV